MTSEARSILAALALGLWLKPENYHARTWTILARWRKRFDPMAKAKPLDRQPEFSPWDDRQHW